MGKKMKLIPFFSNKPTSTTTTRTISTSRDPVLVENSLTSPSASPLPWQWASCANINTLSFRDKEDVDVLRMVNSAYACCSNSPSSSIVFNNKGNANAANCSSSSFAEEKDEREEPIFSSFSTAAEEGGPPSPSSFSAAEIEEDDDRAMEMVIKGLKSERLFFEPVGVTNSILEENNIINDTQRKSLSSSSSTTTTNPVDITTTNSCSCGIHNGDETATTDETAVMVPYKESVIISMESKDPCGDFRQSMEEMVEAHGVKDWEGMEELLAWYLKVNGKNNHGYIVSAFVDLLIDLTSSTSPPPPPRMSSSKNDDKNNDMMMNSSTSTSSVSANCSSGSSTSSFSICHYSSPSPSSSSPLSFPCSPRRSGSSSSAVVAAVSSGGHLSCSLLDPGDGAH